MNTPTHTTIWEDNKKAMLATCNGIPFSPGNSPILDTEVPIACPKCHKPIKLVWNVYIKEISEMEAEKLQKKAGII